MIHKKALWQVKRLLKRECGHINCLIFTDDVKGHRSHYCNVITSTTASQITNLSTVHSAFYSGALQKKTSKLRVAGLCEGNPPATPPAVAGGFASQRASKQVTRTMWLRHHVLAFLVPIAVLINQRSCCFSSWSDDHVGNIHPKKNPHFLFKNSTISVSTIDINASVS